MVFEGKIVIKNKDRMKQLVTVNMPEVFYECLKKLVEIGLYASKSEAIRVAVRDFFENDVEPDDFKRALKHLVREHREPVYDSDGWPVREDIPEAFSDLTDEDQEVLRELRAGDAK